MFFYDRKAQKLAEIVRQLQDKLNVLHTEAVTKYSVTDLETNMIELGVPLEPLYVSITEWQNGVSICIDEEHVWDDEYGMDLEELTADDLLEDYRDSLRERARQVGMDL